MLSELVQYLMLLHMALKPHFNFGIYLIIPT